MRPRAGSALLLLACSMMAPAHAGQACDVVPTTPQQMQDALRLAAQVQARLDASGARAVLLARVGSDVSQYGLRWTHAGLATRPTVFEPWTLLHKLNQCGTADARLYHQGLGNFFLDTPSEYRALVVVPDARFEQALIDQVARREDAGVDDRHYSLLAYPFATRYQNSNGWLLEFLAVAESGGALQGRKAAQAALKSAGYTPDAIPVGPLERVGASATKANVAFLDHPLGERLAGRYSVVTVESIVRYLQARGEIRSIEEVRLP